MKNSNSTSHQSFLRNNLLNLHVNESAMHTKLTLNIDKNTIEKAKLYAKQQNLSLSKLIEAYLNALTQKEQASIEISPLVQQLTGVIPITFEEKEAYQKYQAQKHA